MIAVNLSGKQLSSFPNKITHSGTLTELDISKNNLKDFTGFKIFPNLELLNASENKIKTFNGACECPSLESIVLRNNPISNETYLKLMALIAFGMSLKRVNQQDISTSEYDAAEILIPKVQKFIQSGWVFTSIEPIKLLNPITRKRKTVFMNVSIRQAILEKKMEQSEISVVERKVSSPKQRVYVPLRASPRKPHYKENHQEQEQEEEEEQKIETSSDNEEKEEEKKQEEEMPKEEEKCNIFSVELQVIEANNLIANDFISSDPYVKVEAPFFEGTTKVIESNLNPVWDQTFVFQINDKANDEVKLTIYDKDVGCDDELGIATIKFDDTEPGKIKDLIIPLGGVKNAKGTIHITYKLSEVRRVPIGEAPIENSI